MWVTATRIAGYEVQGEIGRGGMAVVHRVTDLRLDRTVALKLPAPEMARNDTFRRRFTQLKHIVAGCTCLQAARQTGLAKHTVDAYQRRVRAKLDITTTAELTRPAISLGL